jgi:Ca-activated chloride channel family protein
MNAKSTLLSLFFVLSLSLALPAVARADGIIIPDPMPCSLPPCPEPIPMEQLDIRYHHVDVTIEDQIAVTHVDQVFYNPNSWQIEGTYIFPIPVDAVVTNFILWVDGKPVQGQVLEAEQARQVYVDIVNTMRDPALLEYIGRGAVQARIFPIPPQGERRIELEYTQVLTAENGLVRYVYPLSTEKFSASPIESVVINVEIDSSIPIRAVYSPSHEVAVSRESANQVKVGYEAANVLPDTDFTLYYSLGESEAFHIMTFRDPSNTNDPDGFFLALIAPQAGRTEQVIPKDIILVLDQSGSMDGEKFSQAQEALLYILDHLNAGDRFNIISFSTGTQSYAQELRPASETVEARGWVSGLSAHGATDINRALLEAAALVEETSGGDGDRPAYIIFLTDGLPTEGEVDSQKILDNFRSAASDSLRLFAFGLGYDVDTLLLDTLAQENHGASSYVLPDERLDEQLSAFYTKISTPVLTNLELDFGDLRVYDLYPNPLPDLFMGSQIIVVGRYKDGGEVDVSLAGEFNQEPRRLIFTDQVFDQQSAADSYQTSTPRLWATRKIGYLLNQIRLNGPDQETIDQIVRLSIRYGIVTPYTSYLVTEEMALGAEAQERIAAEEYNQMAQSPAAPVSGQEAVQKSADQSALGGASSAYAPPAEAADMVKIVGARTFVWSEATWIDTAFDPEQMETIKLAFLSPDYLELVMQYPDLAAAFALGEHVIAISQGRVYEVLPEDAQVASLPEQILQNPAMPPAAGPVSTSPVGTPVSIDPTSGPSQGEPTPSEGAGSDDQPTEEAKTGAKPCVAGLLPLVLVPIGLIISRKSRRWMS